MNNISFSNKFSPQHDNGERNLYWRKGLPKYNGTYLITTIFDDVRPFHYRDGILYDEVHPTFPKENVIAYMKLPTPYKPD